MPISELLKIASILETLLQCPQLPKCPRLIESIKEARELIHGEIAYRVGILGFTDSEEETDTDSDTDTDPEPEEKKDDVDDISEAPQPST